jgi:aspartate aminotransferase-like enzyme
MQKKYLMTPGPTPVPAEVLLAQARPMIHHRTTEFSAILSITVDGLKKVFQTENDVLVMACSGTGVMESAFANCFCAGDTVIVARNGKFGDRMVQLAEAYGLTV